MYGRTRAHRIDYITEWFSNQKAEMEMEMEE